ncbi:MAG: TlpA disulfide reductase family protein [Candidatus Omnitrophota bacterium]
MRSLMGYFVAGFILLSSGCANAGFYDNPLIGAKAADFKLVQVKGGTASLESLRKDGKAVVFFWATWCPHCREQLKEMSTQKVALEKLGAAVILVDIGEDKSTVERFLSAKGYDYNVLLDTDSAVAEKYQVVGVPTIVFIGADGKILEEMNGFPENYAEILK